METSWDANGLLAAVLGVEWHGWTMVGWTGNALFFSRFFVQWWVSEKRGRVVVPPLFWWLSLAGSGCLLAYGWYRRDLVFVFAYAFTWIPYIRNLILVRKVAREDGSRAGAVPPGARVCERCGQPTTSMAATEPPRRWTGAGAD